MTHNEIDKIIEKYLKGEATREEIDLLKSFELYSESKIKDHLFNSETGKESIKTDIFNAIQEKKKKTTLKLVSNRTKDESKRIYKVSRLKWIKYTAAAIVVIALGLTVAIKNQIFDSIRVLEPETNLVNSHNQEITPGTNKAVLTLQDGSQIALVKGKVYETKQANSTGENIVYNASASKSSKELVYNYLTVPRGGEFSITLSDGTIVTMNSDTQLKYPVEFIEGQTREIELVYGEAYFDVSPSTAHKGAKFKVINAVQDIEVLGTEFNVRAYKEDDIVKTTLVEGKVAVYLEGKTEYLVPNQQTRLDLLTNTIEVSHVNVSEEISWLRGVFNFRDANLKEIMKVVSRWYDVDVVFQNKALEKVVFEGVLGKKQNLENILETIKTLSVIENYEINEKTIILK